MHNYNEEDLKESIDHIQSTCYGLARNSGWWTDPKTGESIKNNPLTFSNKLMLIVSECAEAMEGDRKNLMDTHLPHRKMAEVELADIIIRAFDLAGGYDYDLGAAVVEKLRYNANRADHKLENRLADNGKAY